MGSSFFLCFSLDWAVVCFGFLIKQVENVIRELSYEDHESRELYLTPFTLHFWVKSSRARQKALLKCWSGGMMCRLPFTCAIRKHGLTLIVQSNIITNLSPVETTFFKNKHVPLLYLHNIVSMEEQHSYIYFLSHFFFLLLLLSSVFSSCFLDHGRGWHKLRLKHTSLRLGHSRNYHHCYYFFVYMFAFL